MQSAGLFKPTQVGTTFCCCWKGCQGHVPLIPNVKVRVHYSSKRPLLEYAIGCALWVHKNNPWSVSPDNSHPMLYILTYSMSENWADPGRNYSTGGSLDCYWLNRLAIYSTPCCYWLPIPFDFLLFHVGFSIVQMSKYTVLCEVVLKCSCKICA